ncbi:unnamed protein product [Paramecium sonneborni]|uniref:Uncharacterized protein n=1 Tax=Paramecium sonneborni TaxID=65129 RepID=A0A8S1R2N1_9CILI|nr:unnamed protein product [Paramecium sonneborni]
MSLKNDTAYEGKNELQIIIKQWTYDGKKNSLKSNTQNLQNNVKEFIYDKLQLILQWKNKIEKNLTIKIKGLEFQKAKKVKELLHSQSTLRFQQQQIKIEPKQKIQQITNPPNFHEYVQLIEKNTEYRI